MAGKSGPRGAYAKTPQRRKEILETAFEVFSNSGYLNSSMTEIAKNAGLSMPGLTHHFATKQVLLEAVLTERDLEVAASVQGQHGIDFLERLIMAAARDQNDRGLTQLFTILSGEATNPDHPAHSYFRDRYALILQRVESAFDDLRSSGELHPSVSPADAAQMYAALSDGLQLQRLYGTGTSTPVEILNVFFHHVLMRGSTE